MITIDLTMPIQIINMLLLIAILNAVLYRPIRTIIEERRKKMTSLDESVELFKKNGALRLEEFDKKLREARGRAKKEYETLRVAAQAESAEKLAGIRKEVDSQKAGQLAEIGRQFAAAQAELKGQVDSFAGEMASKVLGRAL